MIHDKKIFFWGAVAAVIVSLIAGGFLLVYPWEKLPDEISPGECFSELDGVRLSFCSADLSSANPAMTIAWENHSGKSVFFGEEFSLSRKEGEEWLDCRFSQDVVWDAAGETIDNGRTMKKKYPLWDFDFSRSGTYCFSGWVTVPDENSAGEESGRYEIRLEFELGEGDLLRFSQFCIDEEVYTCQIPSPWGSHNSPDYRLVNDGRLSILPLYETVWLDVGAAEEITLNDSNFNSYFYDETLWAEGYSLSALRAENKKAWRILPGDNSSVKFYFLLQQNDGTYYLAVGFVNDPALDSAGTIIRWVYRLSQVGEELSENMG